MQTDVARAASVDVLLASDSRYAVEQWLRREVGPGPLVAAVGPLDDQLSRRSLAACLVSKLARSAFRHYSNASRACFSRGSK